MWLKTISDEDLMFFRSTLWMSVDFRFFSATETPATLLPQNGRLPFVPPLKRVAILGSLMIASLHFCTHPASSNEGISSFTLHYPSVFSPNIDLPSMAK